MTYGSLRSHRVDLCEVTHDESGVIVLSGLPHELIRRVSRSLNDRIMVAAVRVQSVQSFSSFVTLTDTTPLISDSPSTRSSSGPGFLAWNFICATTRGALPGASTLRVSVRDAS